MLGRAFLEELTQRHSRLGSCLLLAATDAFSDARTGYLKCQAIALLASILKLSQVLPLCHAF